MGENEKRKEARDQYETQRKYLAKIQKVKKNDTKMNEDKDEDDDDEDEDSFSMSSEDLQDIDSDDEMKKLDEYKSEWKEDINIEEIKESDLAPIIIELCKQWDYSKQK